MAEAQLTISFKRYNKEEMGVGLTNSIHQPNKPALKYSSSVNSLSRRILTVSTTERPRLSFPPGVLWLRTWDDEVPYGMSEERALEDEERESAELD